MATVNIPYAEAGLAAFEKLDDFTSKFLLSGSDPRLEPGFPLPVAANQELKQFHVVGVNATGALVPAVWDADPADAVQAIGVVTQAVTGTADGSTTVPTFYSGNFNPAVLVWHASFDTDAKKLAAFVGAPSPTRIVVRARG